MRSCHGAGNGVKSKAAGKPGLGKRGMVEDSFAKGLQVIEALAIAETPLGLTELSDRCGLLKSHVHKYLATLIRLSYVRQVRGRGPYQLTFKLLELASRSLAQADLVSAAREPMQELSRLTRETVTLAIYDQGDAVYVYKIDGTHEVRTHTDVGRRRPAYCVAAGKAILAFQPDSVVSEVAARIEHKTGRTVRDLADLQKQLALVRDRGYAVNWGEWVASVRGLAAPVRNIDGQVVAAINLSIPAERLDRVALARLAPVVISFATRISRELGYVANARAPSITTARPRKPRAS
jgi:IclR family transcriptional regulator, KDG regulon repressor